MNRRIAAIIPLVLACSSKPLGVRTFDGGLSGGGATGNSGAIAAGGVTGAGWATSSSGGMASSGGIRAAGGMNGTGGSFSASGGSVSTTDLDTCLTDADCTPCLWAPAPTDPSQCPGYFNCCGGFSATKKRCESNHAAWNAWCSGQSPQNRVCPCILLCEGDMAISCVEGRCIFTCPTHVDAAADVAFVATDASPDIAFVDNRDGKAILILDAQPHGSGAVDTGSNAALDAFCDPQSIWQAVSAGLPVTDGGCYLTPKDSAGNVIGNNYIWGNIVLDIEGRVTDNTGYYMSAAQRQAWLDSVVNDRWPCLAGQTLAYSCFVLKA